MEGEEAMKIFDLVVKEHMLPATMDKLVPLSFIGAAAVKFYQAKVKLMDQLGMSEQQRKATLADGQDAGEMLLNIEARIGELLPAPEEARKMGGARGGKVRQGKEALPVHEGLTDRRAHQSRTIHHNPAAVKAIIKEARENEDIPTKTAVLNRIRYENEKARPKKDPGEFVTSAEEAKYLHTLEWIISELPAMPPKKWSDKGLALATGYAKIIRKRLEVFDGTQSKVLSS